MQRKEKNATYVEAVCSWYLSAIPLKQKFLLFCKIYYYLLLTDNSDNCFLRCNSSDDEEAKELLAYTVQLKSLFCCCVHCGAVRR